LGVELDEFAALNIAQRARGTPRIANHLTKWTRDYALTQGFDTITADVADAALNMRGVDTYGLTMTDRAYLGALSPTTPIGVSAVGAFLGEETSTLEDAYEPYLLREGYIMRTPRGRLLTDRGVAYLTEMGIEFQKADFQPRRRFIDPMRRFVVGFMVPTEAEEEEEVEEVEETVAKHGGPGPHKSGSPQSVHSGKAPHWLDDVSLLRRQVQERPDLAPSVQDWSLSRIRELQAEMETMPGSDDPVLGEEIHALTTLYYEARNVEEVGSATPVGGLPGLSDTDLAYAEMDWANKYQASNPVSGQYQDPSVPPIAEGMTSDSILAPITSQVDIADGMYGHYEPPKFSSELQPGDIIFHPRGPVMIDEADFGGGIRPGDPNPTQGMLRVVGHRSDGERVVIDLAPDNQAPPYISRSILEQVGLVKHGGPGPHKSGSPQSIHGNWSRGTSSGQLFNVTTEQGGSTTKLSTGDVPTTGWAVAQRRYSTEITADHDPGPDDVKRYIQSRWSALAQEGNYLGTWYDSETGSLWLDVTQVKESGDEAYEWGKQQGEIAIFNLETFEEVTIDYSDTP
jgi:hypothetical protein